MSTILEKAREVPVGHFEHDPQIQHHFGAGVYARQAILLKNHTAKKHIHEYDHLSILGSGRVMVVTDEQVKEFTAPACILIKAGKEHAIVALEDSIWFCIHAIEYADVDDIDSVKIGELNV